MFSKKYKRNSVANQLSFLGLFESSKAAATVIKAGYLNRIDVFGYATESVIDPHYIPKHDEEFILYYNKSTMRIYFITNGNTLEKMHY